MNILVDIFESKKTQQDNLNKFQNTSIDYLFFLKFSIVAILAIFFFVSYIVLMNKSSTIGYFLKQEINKLDDANLELNKIQLEATELQKVDFDNINTSIVNYSNRPKPIMIKIPIE